MRNHGMCRFHSKRIKPSFLRQLKALKSAFSKKPYIKHEINLERKGTAINNENSNTGKEENKSLEKANI